MAVEDLPPGFRAIIRLFGLTPAQAAQLAAYYFGFLSLEREQRSGVRSPKFKGARLNIAAGAFLLLKDAPWMAYVLLAAGPLYLFAAIRFLLM